MVEEGCKGKSERFLCLGCVKSQKEWNGVSLPQLPDASISVGWWMLLVASLLNILRGNNKNHKIPLTFTKLLRFTTLLWGRLAKDYHPPHIWGNWGLKMVCSLPLVLQIFKDGNSSQAQVCLDSILKFTTWEKTESWGTHQHTAMWPAASVRGRAESDFTHISESKACVFHDIV